MREVRSPNTITRDMPHPRRAEPRLPLVAFPGGNSVDGLRRYRCEAPLPPPIGF